MSENDGLLKCQLEAEIKKDEDIEVSLETARELLGVRNVDKEYEALKRTAERTQFKFNSEKAKQPLRPYQEAALSRMERLQRMETPIFGVQLPTGAGKTYLVHAFFHRNFLRKNKNVLIVTPSWEIANQHASTMCQQFKDGAKRVRRLGGRGQLISVFDELSNGERGKVIITTSALFFARQKSLRESLKTSLVVIDEGHHGWMKKRLNSVQAFARAIGAPSVLLTATPPQNMENLPFAVQLKYLDLVPEFLVPCHVVRLDTGEEFDPVLNNGVLSQSSRVEISSRRNRIEKIVAQSLKHIKGQVIYYAGSVREAMAVVREFGKHGLSAAVVHSKWTRKCDRINALAIERFRSGRVQVLVNVQMLAMGFDVPNVETIIVARPVESDTLFTQMVGRGARPRAEKDKFILIDVHDTIFKPEVAKIFEHRHLFYKGTEQAETPTKPPRPVLPVLHIQPPDPRLLLGFPYSEGIINEGVLAPAPFRSGENMARRRSQLVVNYFLDEYRSSFFNSIKI